MLEDDSDIDGGADAVAPAPPIPRAGRITPFVGKVFLIWILANSLGQWGSLFPGDANAHGLNDGRTHVLGFIEARWRFSPDEEDFWGCPNVSLLRNGALAEVSKASTRIFGFIEWEVLGWRKLVHSIVVDDGATGTEIMRLAAHILIDGSGGHTVGTRAREWMLTNGRRGAFNFDTITLCPKLALAVFTGTWPIMHAVAVTMRMHRARLINGQPTSKALMRIQKHARATAPAAAAIQTSQSQMAVRNYHGAAADSVQDGINWDCCFI
jgi:hypothetical protein